MARTRPKSIEKVVMSQAININQLLDINKNPDAMFSFQIQIPFNALPNFEWPYKDNINCSLRSVMRVELKGCKAEGRSFLIIRKNSTPLNSPLEVIEKSHQKGLFKGGDVLLRANYQTNSFPIYLKVPFTFTADFSQSKDKIKGINYVLKRKIKMFESRGELLHEITEELMEGDIKGNMAKVQTENITV